MAKLSKFDETKIKMVMKIRGISREAAMHELHMVGSAKQKNEEPSVSTDLGDHLMSAKEFFGDTDDDDDFMSAEEFFKS